MKLLINRLFLLGVFLLGCYHTAITQEIEVAASQTDVNHGTNRLHKIIGHDRDHYYVIKFYGTQYYLEKLDRDLNPLLEEPIKLFKGIKTYQLENVFHFYNELYVFVSRTRLNDITLYYQRIDKSTMQPSSDLVEVTTVKNIKGAWADFHFALSRRETKLLIACRTKLSWSKAQFNELFVFGENLSLEWKRKDAFEFKGVGPRDNTYIVDEIGNVSVLSLLKGESILSLIRKNRNLYAIYRYTQQGETFTEYPITLMNKYIRGLRIASGEQGELICAGLYSEIFKTGIRGTFFMRVDPETGRIYDNYLNEFDDALLTQLAEMKDPIIRDEELVNYSITDMVTRENGKLILIAEQVFNQSFDTFNNLIITCYDVNGQVYWTRIIQKNQNFSYNSPKKAEVELSDYRDYIMQTGYMDQNSGNYCSYALLAPLDKTSIIIFYNDNIKNLDRPGENRNFKRPKKSYILAVTIDEFGNLSKKPLVPWKKKALFPEPIRFYDTLHETLVIPAFRYRKFNYYKITAKFL